MSLARKIIHQIVPASLRRERRLDFRKVTHINRALRVLEGNTYIEIGVRNGDCFHQIKAPRKIGVDPVLQQFREQSSDESFFEMTSDDFFAERAEGVFQDRLIDVALVDGLHEFGQSLRDVLNLERYMSSRGVVFIHDCNPPNRKLAEVRDGGPWNGDVWKVAFYLTTCRRDLDFFTLDCDWGLGVLTGFRPARRVAPPAPDIMRACKMLDYDILESERTKVLHLKPCWYSRYFFPLMRLRKKK